MSNLQGAEGRGEKEGAVFVQLGEEDAQRKGISFQYSRDKGDVFIQLFSLLFYEVVWDFCFCINTGVSLQCKLYTDILFTV